MAVKIIIDSAKCDLCGLCVEYCPGLVFSVSNGKIVADIDKCVECYACIPLCPKRAIEVLAVD